MEPVPIIILHVDNKILFNGKYLFIHAEKMYLDTKIYFSRQNIFKAISDIWKRFNFEKIK
jgi:hypothetical protein